MPGINFCQVHLAKSLKSLRSSVILSLARTKFVSQQLDSAGLKLEGIAAVDDLTGLMTRHPFTEYLVSVPRTAVATSAVVFIDLDRFKPINDEYGHLVGDALLVELSARLQTVMTSVCRYGGDEFVGVIEFETDEKDLGLIDAMYQIANQINQPYFILEDLPDEPLTIRASMGVRLLDLHVDPEKEITDADAAMYTTKRDEERQGDTFYTIFSVEMVLKSRRKTGVDSRSHLLDDPSKISLRYQLIYNLNTAAVAMAEANIHLPNHSVEHFMAHRERRNAAMRPIFLATFEAACIAAMGWPKNAIGKEIILSFNLSINILDRNLNNSILEIIDRTGLPCSRVQFEILERGKLLGNDEAKASIDALRAKGITFFLDDVGEGNANIKIIHEYEKYITGYKIGTTFTRRIRNDPTMRGLVQSLLFMGIKLDKNTVVEGIETIEALELVAEFDPPYIQGYLLHKPEEDGPSLHCQMSRMSDTCHDLLAKK